MGEAPSVKLVFFLSFTIINPHLYGSSAQVDHITSGEINSIIRFPHEGFIPKEALPTLASLTLGYDQS